jgi:predicted GIY-YIG superfamily endonuclease
MQDFYVYILLCNDGSYYVGHTDNMEARFSAHEQRLYPCSYTAKRLPVKLVFVQETSSRCEALEAERQIKNWSRKKKQALIAQDIDLLKSLSISGARRKRLKACSTLDND